MNLEIGRAWIAKFVPAVGKKNVNADAKLKLGEFYPRPMRVLPREGCMP